MRGLGVERTGPLIASYRLRLAAFGRSEQPDETALIAESGFPLTEHLMASAAASLNTEIHYTRLVWLKRSARPSTRART